MASNKNPEGRPCPIHIDVYFTLAMILLGLAMWRHPRLGPIYGGITVLIGAFLWAFNVATFPVPPANAGLIDLGLYPAPGLLSSACVP